MRNRGRVFVGLDGSPASLEALRRGLWEARERGAELHAVYVRPFAPSRGYDFGTFFEAPSHEDLIDRDADDQMNDWLRDALGRIPTDIAVHLQVVAGEPGPSLIMLAADDDLIIVGASRPGLLRRAFSNRTGKYCMAKASCPVLLVPSPRLEQDLRRRRKWMSATNGDLWQQFEVEALRRPRQP